MGALDAEPVEQARNVRSHVVERKASAPSAQQRARDGSRHARMRVPEKRVEPPLSRLSNVTTRKPSAASAAMNGSATSLQACQGP
jgi:hypothetical protein